MPPSPIASPHRRRFLVSAGALSGAFVVGFAALPSGLRRAMAQTAAAVQAPVVNWLSLSREGVFTLISAKVEMGQGAFTAWSMTVAEELGVPLAAIRIETAPADPARYRDPSFQKQATWGSAGISAFFGTLSLAAATMRESLIAAAAQRWQVDPRDCSVGDGKVLHAASQRALPYGELADEAARLPRPSADAVKVKSPAAATVVGKPLRRVDAPAKINGTAKFGLDVVVPGMKTALLLRPPKFGATMKSFDRGSIRDLAAMVDVQPTSEGLAIIADHFWAAKKAKNALKVEWNAPAAAHPDSGALEARYRQRMQQEGVLVVTAGKPGEYLGATSHVAEYHAPFLAHAPMEPLNCSAHFRDGELHLWVGTQDQELTLEAARELSQLPQEKIHIHSELLGGGFGRRAAVDFVKPAIEIALRVQYPVKLVFERADDIQGFYYRPASLARLEASLTAEGRIGAWRVKVVCPSIMQHFNREHVKNAYGEYDFFAVQGLPTPIYSIPHRETRWVREETGIPAWVWRGVGLSQNVFFLESFIDELAHAAKQDPVAFRLANIPAEQAAGARAHKVLQLAAEKAGWGKPPAAGKAKRARGVALHAYNGVYLALVAEVSMEGAKPRVHHVTFVCDCGRVVNPNIVRQQMEGGVMMGLSMLHSAGISFKDGAVEQSNFHDYPVARMSDAPSVDCHIVEGSEKVTGLGEFTNTTIAPAVANAVFALTGQRLRRFPLTLG